MKKLITKILVAVIVATLICTLAVGLTACSQKDPDKIYVGLECAYAPFNYTQMDESNGAVPIYDTNYRQIDGFANGYDVMIAKLIAEALGKELVVVKMEWEALIPALNAGTVDFIIAGMSPTEERKQAIDFSEPYYQSNLVLVVRSSGNFANATSLNDFENAKIAAQKDTFHDRALEAQQSQFKYVRQTPLDDFPALINALKTNAIDAYVAEEPGAIENVASSNGEFKYIPLQNNSTGFTATDADTAIAVGIKKNSSLTAQVNEVLAGITQAQRNEMMEQAIELSTGSNVVE